MKRKDFILNLLTLFLLLVFAGCSDEVNFPGNDSTKEPEMVISDIVSIPVEKIRTLNPLLTKDEDAYYLNKLIYQGLFELDEALEAKGVLTDSYFYDEKGILILTLAEDVTWHDGERFTSKDVKFSIDAYKSVPAGRQGAYGSAASLIKAVKVIDTNKVQIQFVDINNSAIENLTFPILPSHKYKNASDMIKNEKNFVPMGTGPYRISKIEEGREITLAGNPNYRGIEPKNTLVFKSMPKKEDALNLFNLGEVNLTYLRDIDRDTLIENKAVRIVSFLSNEVEVLGFNFNHGALQNQNVRRAIAHAINNKAILETCYFNSGVLNDGIYYPGYLGTEINSSLYDYDMLEAAKVLKSSGSEGLSLDLIFNGENQSRNLAAQIIKTDLERIGISINLVSLSKDEYENRLVKGNFDLYIGGFKINENYDLRPLLSTKGAMNHVNYSNPILDELLDKLQKGISLEEKRETFNAILELYSKEIPYHCILYKTYGFATSIDLTGDIRPYFNNVYNGCENWRMTYEKPME